MDKDTVIKKVDRLRIENDLKQLAKSQKLRNMGDYKQKSKDMKTYRNREKLTNEQLRSKVNELRLKDQLRREVSKATSVYATKGRDLVNTAAGAKPGLKPYVDYGKSAIDYALGTY